MKIRKFPSYFSGFFIFPEWHLWLLDSLKSPNKETLHCIWRFTTCYYDFLVVHLCDRCFTSYGRGRLDLVYQDVVARVRAPGVCIGRHSGSGWGNHDLVFTHHGPDSGWRQDCEYQKPRTIRPPLREQWFPVRWVVQKTAGREVGIFRAVNRRQLFFFFFN